MYVNIWFLMFYKQTRNRVKNIRYQAIKQKEQSKLKRQEYHMT